VFLYWLLGSSVMKIGTRRTVYPPLTACKRREARVVKYGKKLSRNAV